MVAKAAEKVRGVVAMGAAAAGGAAAGEIISKNHWVADRAVTHCYIGAPACGAEFTLLVRRHHCRCCGNVYCHKCCCMRLLLDTKSAMPTAHVEGSVEGRVCYSCYDRALTTQRRCWDEMNTQRQQDGVGGTARSVSVATSPLPSHGEYNNGNGGLSLDGDRQLSAMQPISGVGGIFREGGATGDAEAFASGSGSSSLEADDDDHGGISLDDGENGGLSLDGDLQLSAIQPISSGSGDDDDDDHGGISLDDGKNGGLSLDDDRQLSAIQPIIGGGGGAAGPPAAPPSDFASARARIEAFSKNPDGYLSATKSSTATATATARHSQSAGHTYDVADQDTAQTTSALDRMSRDASPAELRQLLSRFRV